MEIYISNYLSSITTLLAFVRILLQLNNCQQPARKYELKISQTIASLRQAFTFAVQ